MKLLIVVVIYFVLSQDVKGYGSVTHSEASKRCMVNGGLASYEHFDIQDRKLTLNEEQANNVALRDRESAWIKGYAKFSTFLSWYGCYSGENEYFKVTFIIPGNDINVCSNYCMENKTDLTYIGLQRDLCICLASAEFKVRNLVAYSDTQCQTVYATGVEDMSMPKLIRLYKNFKKDEILWEPNPPKLQQCVYAKVRNRKAYYATHSCLTLDGPLMFHGFICVKNTSSNLNETCRQYHPPEGDTPVACFVEETSSAIDARNSCRASNGKLIGRITQSLRENELTNKKYWTGIFRSFIIEHNSNQDYACLAATKVDNTLVLDPDDCNVAKRFLCNNNLTNTHTTNTTESNKNTDTKTWRIQNTKSDITIASKEKSEGTSAETNEDLYIYVGVGVSVFLVFTVIIIVVVCRCRKSRMSATQGKVEEKKTGNNAVCAKAYHLTALKDDTNNSHNPISEIEKEQYDLAHQNYDSANQYDPASGASEYDKVNLKYRDKRDKVEHMGSNIYDQTKCVSDLDHYNVAGSSNDNRTQSNTDTDGTYSKFHTGDGDYDSLNQSKKEKLGSVSNESKGKTDNTYDTMK